MATIFDFKNSGILLATKPPGLQTKPAYFVPVPSQDKLGGLCQEGHLA